MARGGRERRVREEARIHYAQQQQQREAVVACFPGAKTSSFSRVFQQTASRINHPEVWQGAMPKIGT